MEKIQPPQIESLSEKFRHFSDIVDQVQPQLDVLLDPTSNDFFETFDLEEAGFEASISFKDVLDLPENCSYLATGLSSVAIRHTSDAGDYVLRFPRSQDPHDRAELVESRKDTRLWGKGAIPGVEEIVALSHATGVVVTHFIEGVPPKSLSDADKEKISSQDLNIVHNTLVRLHTRGLCLDGHSNCLVNPDATTGRKIFLIDPKENDNPRKPHTPASDLRMIQDALALNSLS